MNKCFECESVDDIHQHHVVPRSLGGTKTVPLCARCHGLVHGRDMTRGSVLIKQALARKRAQGRKTNKEAPIGTSIAADGDTLVINEHEQKAIARVKQLREIGFSVREICERMTSEGFKPRGARWHATTINRLLTRDTQDRVIIF